MTDAIVKLRGKLPKDAVIHRSAAHLFDQGKGTRGFAVIEWIVDETKDGLDGDGVRIMVDTIEVATGDLETAAKQLLADLIDARGGNDPQLPFNEADLDRYRKFLSEWQNEEGHDQADVQRLWNAKFNASEDPELHVTGPVGATAHDLYEFLCYVGAIDETAVAPSEAHAGETVKPDDE